MNHINVGLVGIRIRIHRQIFILIGRRSEAYEMVWFGTVAQVTRDST
jgi:hypothetical protein